MRLTTMAFPRIEAKIASHSVWVSFRQIHPVLSGALFAVVGFVINFQRILGRLASLGRLIRQLDGVLGP